LSDPSSAQCHENSDFLTWLEGLIFTALCQGNYPFCFLVEGSILIEAVYFCCSSELLVRALSGWVLWDFRLRGPWTRLSGSNVANTAACLPPLCLWLAKVTSTTTNIYSGIPFYPKISKSANLARKGERHSPCAESVFSAQVTLRNEAILSFSRVIIGRKAMPPRQYGPDHHVERYIGMTEKKFFADQLYCPDAPLAGGLSYSLSNTPLVVYADVSSGRQI